MVSFISFALSLGTIPACAKKSTAHTEKSIFVSSSYIALQSKLMIKSSSSIAEPYPLLPQRTQIPIPSKDGALQAVLQVHRIAQVEHSPPMQTQLCMRYGQRTNIPFPLTQTVVAVLPQVRPKLTVLILRCPQRNRQEADIPLRGGEHQVLRLPRLISRAASTLLIRLQPCMQFGRVMLQQRIP